MKYRFICFLVVLPWITSCIEQESYYEENYYNPPPTVRIENPHYYPNHNHHHGYYRSAPSVRIYQGHPDFHGPSRVIVHPSSRPSTIEPAQPVRPLPPQDEVRALTERPAPSIQESTAVVPGNKQ